MKRILLIMALLCSAQIAAAEVLFQGGGQPEPGLVQLVTIPSVVGKTPSARHAADMNLLGYCQTEAPFCLVADSRTRRLNLFREGRGIKAWDIIMLSPRQLMRGSIAEIDLDPNWCPTASVRRKFPNLPKGCLPPGHRLNAMGEVKIIMDGDFEGTAIRIHDTAAFGGDWPNEDSSGCVRVLDLKTTVLPEIGYGHEGSVEVVFR